MQPYHYVQIPTKNLEDPIFDVIYSMYKAANKHLTRGFVSKERWIGNVERGIESNEVFEVHGFFQQQTLHGYVFIWQDQTLEKKLMLNFRLPKKMDEALKNCVSDFISATQMRGPIVIKTKDTELQELCSSLKLTHGNAGVFYKLELDKTPVETLKEWSSTIPEELQIEFVEYLNEPQIHEASDMMNRYLNDMMRPDKHITFNIPPEEIKSFIENAKKNGVRTLHLILRDSSNKSVGFCFGVYDDSAPNIFDQKMTGIDAKYRGLKLGRAMKSLCYLEAKERFPSIKHVITDNFKDNIPIVKTNESMGFELEYIEEEYYSK
jgi:RimJ/RimL family protein N-acetyltransferase